MSRQRSSAAYLRDILDACEKAEQFIAGMDFGQFTQDEKTCFAVIRALEVIGEASRKVAPDLIASHPEIPWREMAGIRDKLIHDYFGVNLAVVRKTLKEDIPPLKSAISFALTDEGSGGDL